MNPDIKVLLTLDKSNFPMGVKNVLNGGDIPSRGATPGTRCCT